MSVTPSRSAAYRVLHAVRERGSFAPEVLDRVLRDSDIARPDAAHATRLAYGALQYAGTLDVCIDRFAHHPTGLEPALRDVLRVAVYEILYGEAAHHAAVHQAVEAVRSERPAAAGLANAILRRLIAELDDFPWGDPDTDLSALALLTGHPAWLVEMWTKELGAPATRQLLEADNEQAPLYLRHNPFRGDERTVLDLLELDGARPSACELHGCLWAGTPAAAVNGRAIEEGFAVITDAAAQLATHVAAPAPGMKVIEIGAGRGNKTFGLQALAVQAGGPCDLYATDVSPNKIRMAEDRAAFLGVPGVRWIVADGRQLVGTTALPGAAEADLVFLDAPCSGLGTLRRYPEKRWRVRPDNIPRLALLQSELLASAAALVRSGGAIVYSTCTISLRENHEVVKAFLGSEAGRGFRTAPLGSQVPEAWRHWLVAKGWFQSLPSRGGPDGHFIARLERA